MKCEFVAENGYYRCKNCGGRSNTETEKDCDVEKYPITRFVKEIGRYVQSGFKNVSKDEYHKRLEICKTCEHYSKSRCKLCGCFMNIKARGKVWKCKLNKWENEDVE